MSRLACLCIGVMFSVTLEGTPAPQPQAPDLDSVLQRVGRYVAQYQQEFSLLIADEHYLQEVLSVGPGALRDVGPHDAKHAGPDSPSAARDRRVLVSEFALVRVEDADRTLWLAFRDVLEVDGRPVRDHTERLQRLFMTPAANALAQAQAIARESARYNIGALVRTVNVPTMALEFLGAAVQKRSSFKKRGDANVQGVETWVVTFEERGRPTLIRTPEGRDVVTKGVAWIDPDNGRILRTQIEPEQPRVRKTRLTVTYASDTRLGLWVPVEMNETYETESWQISGEATYTNYRRFETDVKLRGPVRGVR